jgi:hypothetical protein
MDAVFVTLVRSAAEASAARLLIAGLRRFGGEIGACPVLVFVTRGHGERWFDGPRKTAAGGDESEGSGEALAGEDAGGLAEAAPGEPHFAAPHLAVPWPVASHPAAADLAAPGVEVLALDVPPSLAAYPYGAKVLACARAEARAQASTRSLIWLDPECLVVRPPVAFDLGAHADAAVRPVHLRGVGLTPREPLDAFWGGICAALGVEDLGLSVESFVEGVRLRAFFNSHGFAVRPGLGICRRWLELFEALVEDAAFQQAACGDDLHRIFLFQAVFSALVDSSVEPARLRILPPGYTYPYNLHARVPEGRRAAALDDLVSFAYEGRSLRLVEVGDVEIREPLRSWLEGAVTPAATG